MKAILPLIAALLCLAAAPAQAADPELVLVASQHSPLHRLAVADVRRLFLGMPVRVQGQAIRAIRNGSDRLVTEIFMQKVMFMSAEDYERQIKSRLSRVGGSRPPVYEENGELLASLQKDPLAVSYMLRSQALAAGSLKVVGEP